MQASQGKECFVIAPIGPAGSDIRKKSDQIFKHIIQKTLEPLSYKAVRADHIAEPGIITSQVIQRLNDSSLVIADLSGHNPNVFYELAVRHAANKPVIQLITKGEQIPFDVSAARTIMYDLNDLDTIESAKDELAKEIKAIESKETTMDNPITVAIGMKLLKESPNPEQRSIAEVMEAISDLRSEVHQIRNVQAHSRQSDNERLRLTDRMRFSREEMFRLSELRHVRMSGLQTLEKKLASSGLSTSERRKLEFELEQVKQEISEIEDKLSQLT